MQSSVLRQSSGGQSKMTNATYSIVNSTPEDIEIIFSFFDAAIDYQKKNGYELWPRFKRELIEKEIDEGRHWKITSGDQSGCVFSVLYNDPLIWLERDSDPAVYLHRIAVNPEFKGQGFMKLIREWAIGHARQNGKKYVRMDTWGENQRLREYYINSGFHYIGQHYQGEAGNTEENYGGPVLSLFEIEV